MSRTTTAADVRPGDRIIGDPTHPAGMLDMTVIENRVGRLCSDLRIVICHSGPYRTERRIAYDKADALILGRPTIDTGRCPSCHVLWDDHPADH